jgi:hypothetical protein
MVIDDRRRSGRRRGVTHHLAIVWGRSQRLPTWPGGFLESLDREVETTIVLLLGQAESI